MNRIIFRGIKRLISFRKRISACLKKYWGYLYIFLVPLCLIVIPYVVCHWPNTFLVVTDRRLLVALLLVIGVALLGLLRPSGRNIFSRHIRLISALKYSFFFGFLLVYLPLTACKNFPLHNLLGGLFVELDGLTIFFVSTAMFVAMWSLAFTQGITIDSIEVRFRTRGVARIRRGDHIWKKRYIPKWAYKFFNSAITPAQLSTYFLLILVGLGVMIGYAEGGIFVGFAWALVGLCCGFLLVDLFTSLPFLLRLPNAEYRPLPYSLLNRVWIADSPNMVRLRSRMAGMSNTLSSFSIPLEHVMAFGIGIFMLSFPALFAWITPLDPNWHALGHIYLLIIILIFFISGLDFIFAQFRVSFVLVLIPFIFFTYNFLEVDHYYAVERTLTEVAMKLKPVKVAKGDEVRPNLVVVASTGGGIWAAGWTTKALKELITARPELIDEIRLLSTVSGGTVGAAYYIHDLCRAQKDVLLNDRVERKKFLEAVHAKAVSSSLSAVTYGFAYLDSPRLFSGGLLSLVIPRIGNVDRGLLHEERWASIAGSETTDGGLKCQTDTMLGLREDIRHGRIPAPIFNTTAMESGRRIMITPINFDTTNWANQEERADTLSELLFAVSPVSENGKRYIVEADLSLWTAARLSAAFPYITPAARAQVKTDTPNIKAIEGADTQNYHLIDGGYYDNFGVASVLDWLEPVLRARVNESSGLEFSKVAIIELRAFPLPRRFCYEPLLGVTSALIGPPIGLYNIRTGAAFSHNEIELTRFIEAWKSQLEDEGVEIQRFIFQPPQVSVSTACQKENQVGPLSWHLTEQDKRNLDDQWQLAVEKSGELTRLVNFLGPTNQLVRREE